LPSPIDRRKISTLKEIGVLGFNKKSLQPLRRRNVLTTWQDLWILGVINNMQKSINFFYGNGTWGVLITIKYFNSKNAKILLA